eukprot:12621-Heterococcus_DN1.PRE.1
MHTASSACKYKAVHALAGARALPSFNCTEPHALLVILVAVHSFSSSSAVLTDVKLHRPYSYDRCYYIAHTCTHSSNSDVPVHCAGKFRLCHKVAAAVGCHLALHSVHVSLRCEPQHCLLVKRHAQAAHVHTALGKTNSSRMQQLHQKCRQCLLLPKILRLELLWSAYAFLPNCQSIAANLAPRANAGRLSPWWAGPSTASSSSCCTEEAA